MNLKEMCLKILSVSCSSHFVGNPILTRSVAGFIDGSRLNPGQAIKRKTGPHMPEAWKAPIIQSSLLRDYPGPPPGHGILPEKELVPIHILELEHISIRHPLNLTHADALFNSSL